MPTLHLHLDESGNFVFSSKGTRYYIFTAAWTYDPAPLAAKLSALRFELIKAGHGERLSGFHACDDPYPRRERVVSLITSQPGWNFASMVVEKCKVNPTLYQPEKFYPKFLTMVANFVFRGRVRPRTSQVLIYTDTLPFPKPQAKAVETSIKASCNRELNKIPFHVLHHRIESNYWIQVTDYCSWSVCRKWEGGDTHFYDLLKNKIAAPELIPMTAKPYY
jgi:hypothetical protein